MWRKPATCENSSSEIGAEHTVHQQPIVGKSAEGEASEMNPEIFALEKLGGHRSF